MGRGRASYSLPSPEVIDEPGAKPLLVLLALFAVAPRIADGPVVRWQLIPKLSRYLVV